MPDAEVAKVLVCWKLQIGNHYVAFWHFILHFYFRFVLRIIMVVWFLVVLFFSSQSLHKTHCIVLSHRLVCAKAVSI